MKKKEAYHEKVIFVFICVLTLTSCAPLSSRYGDQRLRGGPKFSAPRPASFVRKKISLLPFFNESSKSPMDLGEVATEELKKGLSRSKEFLVNPEGTRVLFVPSRQIYTQAGSDLAAMAKSAKLSGISFIIYGRVIDARAFIDRDEAGFFKKSLAQAKAKVEIRVFDVNSNREVSHRILEGSYRKENFRFYQRKKEGSHLSRYRQLLRHVVKKAVRKGLPLIAQAARKTEWTGRVAKIIGSKIYISAGRKSGIQLGDVMKVMTEGTEIYDPQSGTLIGVSEGELKGTLEVIDYFGPDGAVAILHSGGSIIKGDFVRLYE
ncbi:MAG: hypothetical protein OXB88_03700 [Bacteriovoracales bacterium]|nr:hypothetical protein [Bacteriovoracales bacterium]